DRLTESRGDASWDLGSGSRFDFGTDYRDSKVRSTQSSTYQPLGDWGVAFPGDVQALAPGQLFEFCLPCKFHNLDLGATGDALKAYRVEDVTKLWSILSAAYPAPGAPGFSDDRVREKIWSVYDQVTWDVCRLAEQSPVRTIITCSRLRLLAGPTGRRSLVAFRRGRQAILRWSPWNRTTWTCRSSGITSATAMFLLASSTRTCGISST